MLQSLLAGAMACKSTHHQEAEMALGIATVAEVEEQLQAIETASGMTRKDILPETALIQTRGLLVEAMMAVSAVVMPTRGLGEMMMEATRELMLQVTLTTQVAGEVFA